MEKKSNAADKLSFHWRNESSSLSLNRYEIDSLFQYIRDLKDENTHLKDDIDNYEKKIEELTEKLQIVEFKYKKALERSV